MDNNTVPITLHPAEPEHLEQVYSWFDSEQALTSWGGPGFTYPMSLPALLDVTRLLQVPSYVWLDEQQQVLAFGQFYLRLNRHHLGRLAVSPHARGKGVGTQFIQMLMSTAREAQQARGISLFVLASNAVARRCYEKLGFTYQPYPEPLTNGLNDCLYMVRPDP